MATATITRTDEQIQRDVLQELKWDARVLPNAEIAAAAIRALEWDAWSAPGVSAVENCIIVSL